MGFFMKEDDIYISSMIDLFNLRFAPVPVSRSLDHESLFGGIDEMAALQKEFKVFNEDRTFSQSAAILGLGGVYSARARNRWFTLLQELPDKGDRKIADALIANFAKRTPLPCYMRAHDMRVKGQDKVIISTDRPLFYLEQDYLVISLPMKPRRAPTAKKTKKSK